VQQQQARAYATSLLGRAGMEVDDQKSVKRKLNDDDMANIIRTYTTYDSDSSKDPSL
jgi:hypothetical protein